MKQTHKFIEIISKKEKKKIINEINLEELKKKNKKELIIVLNNFGIKPGKHTSKIKCLERIKNFINDFKTNKEKERQNDTRKKSYCNLPIKVKEKVEKLFWRVFKDKYLFREIFSKISNCRPSNEIYGISIFKYKDIIHFSWMIEFGYFELLKYKIKRNELILFSDHRSNGEIVMKREENFKIKYFKFLFKFFNGSSKENHNEIILFYQQLFKNYYKQIEKEFKISELINESINEKCIEPLIVLIEQLKITGFGLDDSLLAIAKTRSLKFTKLIVSQVKNFRNSDDFGLEQPLTNYLLENLYNPPLKIINYLLESNIITLENVKLLVNSGISNLILNNNFEITLDKPNYKKRKKIDDDHDDDNDDDEEEDEEDIYTSDTEINRNTIFLKSLLKNSKFLKEDLKSKGLKSIFNYSLKELINSCSIIITFDLKQRNKHRHQHQHQHHQNKDQQPIFKTSKSLINTMEEIENIKKKFSKELLNTKIKLIYKNNGQELSNDIKLLLELYLSIDSYSKRYCNFMFHYIYTYQNQDNICISKNNFLNQVYLKKSLIYGSSYYWVKNINITSKYILNIIKLKNGNLNLLFKHCPHDSKKQIDFIKQIYNNCSNQNRFLLFYLLIDFDDLNLIKFVDKNYSDLSKIIVEYSVFNDLKIQRFIKSERMLRYCVSNHFDHFDYIYTSNIPTQVCDFFGFCNTELLELHDRLVLAAIHRKKQRYQINDSSLIEQQHTDDDDNNNNNSVMIMKNVTISSPMKFINSIVGFGVDFKTFYDYIKMLRYVVENIHKNYNVIQDESVLRMVALSGDCTNKQFKMVFTDIKFIINNTKVSYYPYDLFKKPSQLKQFFDWIFLERPQDLQGIVKRCQCVPVVLYKAGNIINLLEKGSDNFYQESPDDLLPNSNSFKKVSKEIGRLGDVVSLEFFLQLIGIPIIGKSKEPSTDLHDFNMLKENLIEILKKASSFGRINIFQHLYNNHQNLLLKKSNSMAGFLSNLDYQIILNNAKDNHNNHIFEFIKNLIG